MISLSPGDALRRAAIGESFAYRRRNDQLAAAASQAIPDQHRQPQAGPVHPDDGLWLRSRAERRLAQAADLPDLDVRFRDGGGRASASSRASPAVTRSGGKAEGLVYSRFNGPNQEILEDRLRSGRRPTAALTFSSGMTAISTLLLTFVRPGDVVVHSGPLYAATETIINKILSQFGIHYVDFPAGATREELDEVMARAKAKGRVALIYLESPANPTNALVDVEAVHAARAAAFSGEAELPPIAIDNTFLGPLWARPLKQGADISVYSLTKYAGGHSDLVAGGAHRTQSAARPRAGDTQHDGRHLRSQHRLDADAQPRDARAADDRARTRMRSRSATFLRDHPKVEKVGYLGFLEEGSRQADIYQPPLHRRRARPSRSISRAASARPSPSSTRSRLQSSRSASAAPRRSPALPRR